MANKKQVAQILAKMSAAFPNWKPDNLTTQVYFEDLQDIPFEELDVAANMARTQPGRAFAPSTAEIRGAVMELRASAQNLPSAGEAWQMIVMGHWHDLPEFVAEAANEMGGWEALHYSSNQAYDRNVFFKHYGNKLDRKKRELVMLPDAKLYLEQHEEHDPPELPERTGFVKPEFDSYRTPDGEEYFE
jgi:hypothetical protein